MNNQQSYYWLNRNYRIKYQQSYYKVNKNRIKQYNHEYYIKNKEDLMKKHREYSKIYNQKNKQKIRKKYLDSKNKTIINYSQVEVNNNEVEKVKKNIICYFD